MSRIQTSMRFMPKMLPKGLKAAAPKAVSPPKAPAEPESLEVEEQTFAPESGLLALAEASASRMPVETTPQVVDEVRAPSPAPSVERSSSPELPVSSPGPAVDIQSSSETDEGPRVKRQRLSSPRQQPLPPSRLVIPEDDEEESEDDIDGDFMESSAVVQLMVDANGNVVVNMETLKRARPILQETNERDIIEEHTREPRNVFDVRRREVKWSKEEVELLWEALSMTGLNYHFLAQWFGSYQDPNDPNRRLPHRTAAQVKTKVISLSRKRALHYDRVVFGDLRRPMDIERFKEVTRRDDL